MQLKLLLAGCIVAACTLCGRSIAWSANRRCKLLEELVNALRMLKVQSIGMLEPLEVALRHTDFPLFAMIAQQLPLAKCASDAWQIVRTQETRRGRSADCLMERETAALDRLFEHLGESGREAQEASIRTCIAAIEVTCTEASEQSAKMNQLYTSIGLLIGLAIAVLMM